MKSLHAFMHNKQLRLAARLDTNPRSLQELKVKTTAGEPVSYSLLSLPLYMVEALPVCIDRCLQEGRLTFAGLRCTAMSRCRISEASETAFERP
jgi:hypothetical protein